MIGFLKHFDNNKKMSFQVIDNKLLKRYNKIWGKVNSLMNIKFDSEPAYGDNDKYIKTKIKLYGDKVNTSFQGKKVPKENASYKCLSLIMLDSDIRVNKKYTQTLLEEYKYERKIIKWRILLMMMNLTMNLKMRLIMNVTIMNLMNNLLKVKIVF